MDQFPFQSPPGGSTFPFNSPLPSASSPPPPPSSDAGSSPSNGGLPMHTLKGLARRSSYFDANKGVVIRSMNDFVVPPLAGADSGEGDEKTVLR